MPRRIPDYPDAYAGWNALSSFGTSSLMLLMDLAKTDPPLIGIWSLIRIEIHPSLRTKIKIGWKKEERSERPEGREKSRVDQIKLPKGIGTDGAVPALEVKALDRGVERKVSHSPIPTVMNISAIEIPGGDRDSSSLFPGWDSTRE
ncbi:unnamed protein product [Lupinus luteus]|uniref:Uncharacterized protein n=1 Tax=Lupinus luteus TaxID=3873 RepID=A0AAV1WWF2_LUPLU